MLQRQIMFKQLQAMQQRQQLQQLNDAKQQQFLNQLSVYNKQTSGLQSSSANGMPIQDASQMFMGGNSYSTQCGMTPNVQGFPNGYVFSQAQNQPIYSLGLPQQIDVSLYGTPIANSREDMNAFAQIQGASQDYANAFNMSHNNQLEMPALPPSMLSNSFVNEQFNIPLDKVGMTSGAFVPKHFGDKKFYGQLPMQSSGDGIQPCNFQHFDSHQKNASSKMIAVGQGQVGWSLQSVEKKTRLEPSRDTACLDPLEEKILFNSDDSCWGSSVGQLSNVHMLGFESNKQVDFLGSFSANNSGSWSALMQSAVAEASSSDTGQQEEWSGLTFQNPELSTDNDHTNYMDDEQQRNWVDSNLQNISSPPSKPDVVLQQSNMNYGFHTFQQDGVHSDFSYESIQQPVPNVSKWLDHNSQPKLSIEGLQPVQPSPQLQNVWQDQPEHSRNNNGNELKTNMRQHEDEPQHMVAGSCTPVDLAPHPWSNQEQGYVDYITEIGGRSGKMQSPDTVSSPQVTQVENQNDILYHDSSSSQGMRSVIPPSQQIPRSFFSPSQTQSNVINNSDPWYQSNELQYEQNSILFNHNGPATFQLATNRGQATVAPSPHPCVPFQNSVEDKSNSNKDSASRVVHPQDGQNCFQVGDNPRDFDVCPETTQGFDHKVDQMDQLNSCKASNPFSLTRSIHGQGAVTSHLSATNVTDTVSKSLHQQGFDKVERRDNNFHVNVQSSDAFGPSLLQKFPLLQQVNANVRQQLLLRLQSGLQNVAQGHTNVDFQINSNFHAENKPVTPAESGGNLPGKHFSETSTQSCKRLPSVETDNHHLPKDHSLFNIQMGPSWFKQYGAMKNGHTLAISNSLHTIPSAQQLSNKSETFQGVVREDPSNVSQVTSISPYLNIKNVASQQFWGNNEQNLAALRSKKRKVSVFDNIPWHKEVTQSIPLHSFSSRMAESEWALALNRLIEKVEDEAEMEDVLPRSQAKKRLLLTTKLMQQVFQPAPAVILSADVSSNIESVVYFVSRLALRDACSLTNGSQNPPASDMSSKELKTSERVDRLDFSKAVEIFNDRAKKLENDLLRMDKTTSIVELKVDYQDLEKFSVINRFARFHSKGHWASGNTSSASSANPAVYKPAPQRYVLPHPMPKVMPEGTNCISL